MAIPVSETFEVFSFGKSDSPAWHQLILYCVEEDELYVPDLCLPLDKLIEVANDVQGRAVKDEGGHHYISLSWAIELTDKPELLTELSGKLREAIKTERAIPQTTCGWVKK